MVGILRLGGNTKYLVGARVKMHNSRKMQGWEGARAGEHKDERAQELGGARAEHQGRKCKGGRAHVQEGARVQRQEGTSVGGCKGRGHKCGRAQG